MSLLESELPPLEDVLGVEEIPFSADTITDKIQSIDNSSAAMAASFFRTTVIRMLEEACTRFPQTMEASIETRFRVRRAILRKQGGAEAAPRKPVVVEHPAQHAHSSLAIVSLPGFASANIYAHLTAAAVPEASSVVIENFFTQPAEFSALIQTTVQEVENLISQGKTVVIVGRSTGGIATVLSAKKVLERNPAAPVGTVSFSTPFAQSATTKVGGVGAIVEDQGFDRNHFVPIAPHHAVWAPNDLIVSKEEAQMPGAPFTVLANGTHRAIFHQEQQRNQFREVVFNTADRAIAAAGVRMDDAAARIAAQ